MTLAEYIKANKTIGSLRECMVNYFYSNDYKSLPIDNEECKDQITEAIDEYFKD